MKKLGAEQKLANRPAEGKRKEDQKAEQKMLKEHKIAAGEASPTRLTMRL